MCDQKIKKIYALLKLGYSTKLYCKKSFCQKARSAYSNILYVITISNLH